MPTKCVPLRCDGHRRDTAAKRGIRTNLKEGYSVDIVIIFARYGAPNTADYPLQRDIAADHRTPTNRHAKPPIPRYSPIKLDGQQATTPDPNPAVPWRFCYTQKQSMRGA